MPAQKLLAFLLCTVAFLFLTDSKEEEKAYHSPFSLSLKGVPSLHATIHDSIRSCKYLLLTTRDYDCNSSPATANNFTVQVIDPAKPYPPLWFFNFICSSESGLSDAKILENGNISFFLKDPSFTFKVPKNKMGIEEAILEGYVQLDPSFDFTEFFASVFMGSFDYQVLDDGRRIFLKSTGKHIDLSHIVFKGTKLKSSVFVGTEKIQIMDSKNNIVLDWNPIDHLAFDEIYYDEYADIISHSPKYDQIDFSRLNSVGIDPFDGNLLVSFNRLDACMKIDISSGKILWKLGGKKSDFPLDDADRFHLQNDFTRISSGPYKGKYSLLSTGNNKINKYVEAMIFDIDEENKKAKVVKRYRPEMNFVCNFNGNFEVHEDETSLVNFADKGISPLIPNFSYVDSFSKVMADFHAPSAANMQRVTCANLQEIKRPVITCNKKEGKVMLTAHGDFDFFQWSTGDTSASIAAADTGAYYVVGQKGIGGCPSEFFYIADLKNFTCPVPGINPARSISSHKVKGRKEPAAGNLVIDLPFYYDRIIKGEVTIDLSKEFYIIKPLAEN